MCASSCFRTVPQVVQKAKGGLREQVAQSVHALTQWPPVVQPWFRLCSLPWTSFVPLVECPTACSLALWEMIGNFCQSKLLFQLLEFGSTITTSLYNNCRSNCESNCIMHWNNAVTPIPPQFCSYMCWLLSHTSVGVLHDGFWFKKLLLDLCCGTFGEALLPRSGLISLKEKDHNYMYHVH